MKDAELAEFKEWSMAFQRHTLTAMELIDACIRLFGSSVADVIPEMIALLPNLSQQHELFIAYNARAAKAPLPSIQRFAPASSQATTLCSFCTSACWNSVSHVGSC